MVYSNRGQTARQALRAMVQNNPKLSQTALLRELRAQGLRISNVSGREIINQSRAEIARVSGVVTDDVKRILTDAERSGGRFVDFTYNESELRGKTRQAIERTLRENIRNREVFVRERSKGTRLSDFTHVVVGYDATATVSVYIEGRLFVRTTKTISGAFTTDVNSFTEELLSARVRQQAGGIITQEFATIQGLGSNSVIDGLETRLDALDVDITSLTPRGSKARRGQIQ